MHRTKMQNIFDVLFFLKLNLQFLGDDYLQCHSVEWYGEKYYI